MATHVDFRVGWQLQIGKRRERPVGFALVNGGKPCAHHRRRRKGDVRHAERRKDPLDHHLAKTFAADTLNHLAAPVDVAAIFPFVAGIEEQRRHEGRLRAGDYTRLAVLLRQAKVVGVEEVVAEAGRVQHQHAGGDVPLRRPQPGLAGSIEPVEHLELADVGDVDPCGGIQVEPTFLDALQDRRAGDRLCGREDREDGVGGHSLTGAKDTLSGSAFVDVGRAVGDHRHDARNTVLTSRNLLQDPVTFIFQVAVHRLLPLRWLVRPCFF